MPLFSDRVSAGKAVALALGDRFRGRDVVVLGLPRGGVPVARAVADALGAPLDVVVARKLGVPGLREVAFRAIAEGSDHVVEDAVRWYLGIPRQVVRQVVERERLELERRRSLYRGDSKLPSLRGRTVVDRRCYAPISRSAQQIAWPSERNVARAVQSARCRRPRAPRLLAAPARRDHQDARRQLGRFFKIAARSGSRFASRSSARPQPDGARSAG